MKKLLLTAAALVFFSINAHADESKYAPPLTLGQARTICHKETHGDLNVYDTCMNDHKSAIGKPISKEDAKILNQSKYNAPGITR